MTREERLSVLEDYLDCAGGIKYWRWPEEEASASEGRMGWLFVRSGLRRQLNSRARSGGPVLALSAGGMMWGAVFPREKEKEIYLIGPVVTSVSGRNFEKDLVFPDVGEELREQLKKASRSLPVMTEESFLPYVLMLHFAVNGEKLSADAVCHMEGGGVNLIKGKHLSTQIRRCCDYISLHIEEDISLEELSRQVGYAENYLSGKFKREVGLSVSAYIRLGKVERAKTLLENTDLTVQEISERLHFCSRGYFSQVFQEVTGLTPPFYRRRFQC